MEIRTSYFIGEKKVSREEWEETSGLKQETTMRLTH